MATFNSEVASLRRRRGQIRRRITTAQREIKTMQAEYDVLTRRLEAIEGTRRDE